MHRLLIVALTGLILAATARGAEYEIETVADDLNQPWSLAFLPDGSMLLTERGGDLHRVAADGKVSDPLNGVPVTYVKSQGGLFDVVLDPDFARNQTIYLSYAGGEPKDNTTTVARARLVGDGLEDIETIFSVTPRKDTPVHFGGRMAFLPDGTLLLTTGDGFDYREAAQNLSSQMGKTIRMTADGEVPADNPFVGRDDADDYIYSYGHRNPQGLAVDPATGTIWQHEHGPAGGDELNVIKPGANYGWPITTFGLDYTGARVTPFTERPGIEPPLVHWTPSIANSGLAIYRGDSFPDWRGSVLVGALIERSVRRVIIENGQVTGQETLLEDLEERIRDVRVGPDGLIYLLTDSTEGKLLRVMPN